MFPKALTSTAINAHSLSLSTEGHANIEGLLHSKDLETVEMQMPLPIAVELIEVCGNSGNSSE